MVDFYDLRRNNRHAWYASVKEKLQKTEPDRMEGEIWLLKAKDRLYKKNYIRQLWLCPGKTKEICRLQSGGWR